MKRYITIIFILNFMAMHLADAGDLPIISAVDLYAEYRADPQAADAKYEGYPIVISGVVVDTLMDNVGVARIRSVQISVAKNGSRASPSSENSNILLCFNETCGRFRRTTITDAQFKTIKEGNVITAKCNAEPVNAGPLNGPPNERFKFIFVSLAKCELR